MRTQYYPQQEIIHFKGFDIEPHFNMGGQWTNAKNLHPVYIKNENNEWEMVWIRYVINVDVQNLY
mgnify:CR=1 FL=1